MNSKTNGHQFAALGSELTPEQLEFVNGGSPYFLGPRTLIHLLDGAGKLVGHVASDVGHAVANAGKKVISFLGSLF